MTKQERKQHPAQKFKAQTKKEQDTDDEQKHHQRLENLPHKPPRPNKITRRKRKIMELEEKQTTSPKSTEFHRRKRGDHAQNPMY